MPVAPIGAAWGPVACCGVDPVVPKDWERGRRALPGGSGAEHVGEHGAGPGAARAHLCGQILARFGGKPAKGHGALHTHNAGEDYPLCHARGQQFSALRVADVHVAAVAAAVRGHFPRGPMPWYEADGSASHTRTSLRESGGNTPALCVRRMRFTPPAIPGAPNGSAGGLRRPGTAPTSGVGAPDLAPD